MEKLITKYKSLRNFSNANIVSEAFDEDEVYKACSAIVTPGRKNS